MTLRQNEELVSGVDAMIGVLKQYSRVTNIVGDRVCGAKLSARVVGQMPTSAVVVKRNGITTGIGSADTIEYTRARIDVFSYGRTDAEAERVALSVHHAVKQFPGSRLVGDGILVRSVTHTAGPIQIEDPETGWPTIIYTYEVLHADYLAS
jgi:hypothetical protein